MASIMYNEGKSALASGLNWASGVDGDIVVALVSSQYEVDNGPDVIPDHTYSDVSSYFVTGTNAQIMPITGRAVVQDNAADVTRLTGDNVTWQGLNTNEEVGGAVVFVNAAGDHYQKLLAFLDFSNVATNGSDVVLQFAGGVVIEAR